jgi:hypothetical protein
MSRNQIIRKEGKDVASKFLGLTYSQKREFPHHNKYQSFLALISLKVVPLTNLGK